MATETEEEGKTEEWVDKESDMREGRCPPPMLTPVAMTA